MVGFRIPCFIAFLLLVNFCTAQNRSYNTIFDSLVIHDKSVPVIEDPVSWQGAKKQKGDVLAKLLEYSGHPDNELFWYLHYASCDTTLPKRISDTIKIWKDSVATRIIEGYWYRDWDRDSDDWYEIVNAVQVKSEVFEDYITKWPTFRGSKRQEGRAIYWLVQNDREDTALRMLKLLVANYVAGGEQYYIANLFNLLCFSKNNAVRSEAIKLLWTCLEYKDEHRLLDLGLYLDEATGIKYLQKWFWYYANQKLEPAPPPLPKNLWRNERITPKPLKSLRDLINLYSPSLVKAMGGKQLWTEFAARMPYWDAYVGIRIYFQLPVLESIFTDSSLTTVDKQNILLTLTDTDYPQNNTRLRYLQLVKQAWPDGNIPDYAFAKLSLCKMVSWQPPVVYPEFAPRNLDVKVAIADIKNAGISDLQLNTDYWKYQCSMYGWTDSYSRFNDNFNDVLKQTGLIRDVGITSFGKPANYKQLFNEKFEALLVKIGVRDIELYEEITKIKTGYLHKLFIRSNEAAYKMEFEGDEYGPFYPQRLVKMINLLLMKKGVKERFIELEYPHYGLEFGLFEPDKIKPLFDKYYVRCFAVGNGGEFSSYGKVELK